MPKRLVITDPVYTLSYLEQLPREILLHICSYVIFNSFKAIGTISILNKYFNTVIDDSRNDRSNYAYTLIWQPLIMRIYHIDMNKVVFRDIYNSKLKGFMNDFNEHLRKNSDQVNTTYIYVYLQNFIRRLDLPYDEKDITYIYNKDPTDYLSNICAVNSKLFDIRKTKYYGFVLLYKLDTFINTYFMMLEDTCVFGRCNLCNLECDLYLNNSNSIKNVCNCTYTKNPIKYRLLDIKNITPTVTKKIFGDETKNHDNYKILTKINEYYDINARMYNYSTDKIYVNTHTQNICYVKNCFDVFVVQTPLDRFINIIHALQGQPGHIIKQLSIYKKLMQPCDIRFLDEWLQTCKPSKIIFSNVRVDMTNSDFKNLYNITLSHIDMKTIPESIYKLDKLVTLSIKECNLSKIDKNIYKMKSLQFLNLGSNKIKKINIEFYKMKCLQYLYLQGNKIRTFYTKITNVLKFIDLSYNCLTHVYINCEKTYDAQFDLRYNRLNKVPNFIYKYENIGIVKVHGNNISDNGIDLLGHFECVLDFHR